MISSWKKSCSLHVWSVDSIWPHRYVTVFNIFVYVLQKAFVFYNRSFSLRHNSFGRSDHIWKLINLLRNSGVILSMGTRVLSGHPLLRLLLPRCFGHVVLQPCEFYLIIWRSFHASFLTRTIEVLASLNQPILTSLMLGAGANRLEIKVNRGLSCFDLGDSKALFRCLGYVAFIRALRIYHF